MSSSEDIDKVSNAGPLWCLHFSNAFSITTQQFGHTARERGSAFSLLYVEKPRENFKLKQKKCLYLNLGKTKHSMAHMFTYILIVLLCHGLEMPRANTLPSLTPASGLIFQSTCQSHDTAQPTSNVPHSVFSQACTSHAARAFVFLSLSRLKTCCTALCSFTHTNVPSTPSNSPQCCSCVVSC